MSEIRTWLDGIGLAQYANAFETNDIDIDLLDQVDDRVLKDIGVSSAEWGNRRDQSEDRCMMFDAKANQASSA